MHRFLIVCLKAAAWIVNAASAGAQTDGSVQMTAVWFGFESGISILRMAMGGRDEGQKEGKAFKRSVWADQIVAAFIIKQHKYYMNQSKQTRRNDAGKACVRSASRAPAVYGISAVCSYGDDRGRGFVHAGSSSSWVGGVALSVRLVWVTGGVARGQPAA